MNKTVREILETLYHSLKMDDLNPTAWGNAFVKGALSELKSTLIQALLSQEEMQKIVSKFDWQDSEDCVLTMRIHDAMQKKVEELFL